MPLSFFNGRLHLKQRPVVKAFSTGISPFVWVPNPGTSVTVYPAFFHVFTAWGLSSMNRRMS